MSAKQYKEIGQQFTIEFGITAGEMFGKPCLKTAGKKAFAAYFKDEMVFKLGEDEINFLATKYPGSVNWDPSGKDRAMKDWLQVPTDFSDDWKALAKQALNFVEGLN